MGGMFSFSITTMVICSKWLMTKVVNITLWAMLCLAVKDLYIIVQNSIQSMQS
jgi:hypothetical protein